MLQKIKKHALSLLVLQLLLTIKIGFYLQNQLDKSIGQKEGFVEFFNHYHQSHINFIEEEAKNTLERMKLMSMKEQVGQEYFEAGLEIQKCTHHFRQKIDAVLILDDENSRIKSLNVSKIASKYQNTILRVMEKIHGGIDLQERTFAAEIYNCYTISKPETIISQFDPKKNDRTYKAFLVKVKNDLQLIEYELVTYLASYVFSSSRLLYGSYPHILACKNKLLEGETLALDISLSNRILNREDCIFVIGKDTLQMDNEKAAHYQIVVSQLGKHELKGRFVCEKGYSHDFSHSYEVTPKCQP